jgi:hypothetical protein
MKQGNSTSVISYSFCLQKRKRERIHKAFKTRKLKAERANKKSMIVLVITRRKEGNSGEGPDPVSPSKRGNHHGSMTRFLVELSISHYYYYAFEV